MNLAPGPQAQINIVRRQLAGIEQPDNAWAPQPTLESMAIVYNAFADVPAFGLPHIEHFINESAAQGAHQRLLAQLLVIHEGNAV